ncbi:MAG: dipeptidase [Kiloniellales bacterium]
MLADISRALAPLSLCVFLSACGLLGPLPERMAGNGVVEPRLAGCPDPQAPDACARGEKLFIADLHTDSLLWGRDLRERSDEGHADFARLRDGGVDFQVFAIPNSTPFPRESDDVHCASGSDFNTGDILFLVNETFRPSTWSSPRSRTFLQVERFQAWTRPGGAEAVPQVIRVRSDVAEIEAWAQGVPQPASAPYALLALEGLNWVHSNPNWVRREIDALIAADFRMVALTHRYSNALAGASEDCEDLEEGRERGLSALGRVAIEMLIDRGVVIDLAHASSASILDATEMVMAADPALKPGLVMSHGGVYRACPLPRNLRDEDLRRIALADGVIGIGFWAEATCWNPEDRSSTAVGTAIEAVTNSFLAALAVLQDPELAEDYEAHWGKDFDPLNHLALGSDFDGAVKMRFDASALPKMLAALEKAECDLERQAGLPRERLCKDGEKPFAAPDVLARIAGGNQARVIANTLREDYGPQAAALQ